jgi:hypothetical protein
MASCHFHSGVLQLPGDIQFQCYVGNKHSDMHDISIEISDLQFFWKRNLLKVAGSRKVLVYWMLGKKKSYKLTN